MRLTKEEISSLVKGRIDGMPDAFVAGFNDIDGKYYPIDALDPSFYTARECELYTNLTHARGGIEFFLRFI